MSVRDHVLKAFGDEGLVPHEWSNAPGFLYDAHDHPYEKVIWCVEGGIEFRLPSEQRVVELLPGKSLVIPPRTPHSAFVGPMGVTCVEGHRFR